MSDTVVWLHLDALRPTNPALLAYPDAPALFVFDDELLAEQRFSLKRIMFIYECLLELPVVIRRGHAAALLVQFAQEHGATRVATVDTAGPYFEAVCDAVGKGLPAESRLEVIPDAPFAAVDSASLDLKRFSRYWGAIRPHVLKRKGD